MNGSNQILCFVINAPHLVGRHSVYILPISRSALCAVGRKTLFIEVPCNQAAVDSAMYVCVCSRQDQLNGSTQIGSGSPSHTRDRKKQELCESDVTLQGI